MVEVGKLEPNVTSICSSKNIKINCSDVCLFSLKLYKYKILEGVQNTNYTVIILHQLALISFMHYHQCFTFLMIFFFF